MHATILKGNMGYDQYTVPDTVAVESYLLLLSFSICKHTSIFSHAILSNFFEEQRTQNYPQYLSGLSRAVFPTTFLEIAVYLRCWCCCEIQFLNKNLQIWTVTWFFCAIYINGVAGLLRCIAEQNTPFIAWKGINARLAKSKLSLRADDN